MEQINETTNPVATPDFATVTPAPEVPYIPMLKGIELALIAGFSIIFALLHFYLFYKLSYGISAPIFTLTFLAGYFYLIKRLGIQATKVHYVLGGIVFLFSLMLAFRADIWLVVMNLIACVYTFFILLIVTFRERLDNLKLLDYTQRIGMFVPGTILGFGSFVRDLGHIKRNTDSKKFAPHIIRGILFAVPAIFIFLILFSSADMVFSKYVSDLFTFNFSPDFPLKVINITFFTLLFLGLISFVIKKSRSSEENIADPAPKGEMHSIEINIMLGSIAALFAIFMILQITYLFSGSAMISVQGYTYSEYARKGFFELIVVACIVLGILWFSDRYLYGNAQKPTSNTYKLISTFLIILTFGVLTSAFTRLSMYESAYGLTELRFYSHAFIIFLAIIFLLFIYKTFFFISESRFVASVVGLYLFSVLVFNLLNPEQFIAINNVTKQYPRSVSIDFSYFNNLSSDAIDPLIESYSHNKQEEGSELTRNLCQILRESSNHDWRELSYSRIHAINALKQLSKKPVCPSLNRADAFDDYVR